MVCQRFDQPHSKHFGREIKRKEIMKIIPLAVEGCPLLEV
jgi:hypothetical protein